MTPVPPTVLISPAVDIGSRYYRLLVEEFDRIGWPARALPRRGHEPDGARASRSHDWSYADEVAVVEREIARERERDPGRPVLLLGHSLGAQLGLGVQLGEHPADALVTVGGCLPHRAVYPRPGVRLLIQAGVVVPVTTRLFGYLPGPFFAGPGARTLQREWARMALTGVTPYREGVSQRPALLIDLEGDWLAPGRAVDAFADRFFPAAQRWTYRDEMVPDGGSNGHIRWARSAGPVVDTVRQWWVALASSPQVGDGGGMSRQDGTGSDEPHGAGQRRPVR